MAGGPYQSRLYSSLLEEEEMGTLFLSPPCKDTGVYVVLSLRGTWAES